MLITSGVHQHHLFSPAGPEHSRVNNFEFAQNLHFYEVIYHRFDLLRTGDANSDLK